MIPFIPLCAPPHKLEHDWAAPCAEVILRRCPICEPDSIIGHGPRYKQAEERKLESEGLLASRYQLAFLNGDGAQMAQWVSAAMGKPGRKTCC